jgi:hypothetical protein
VGLGSSRSERHPSPKPRPDQAQAAPGAAAKHKAKATKTKPNEERLQDPGRVSISPSVSVGSLDGEPLSEGDGGDEQSSEGHFAAMKAKVPRQPGESRKAYRTRVMGHLRKKMADEGVLLGTSPSQRAPAAEAVEAKNAAPKAAGARAAATAPAASKKTKTKKTVVLKPGPGRQLRDRLWGRGRGGSKSGLKGRGKGRGKGKKGKGKGAKGH